MNIIHLVKAFDLEIMNTFYGKSGNIMTYKSGEKTQAIDYFMVIRDNLRELRNLQSDTRGVSCNTAQDVGHGDEGCLEK